MKKTVLLLFILSNVLFASIGQITALVGEVKISRDSKQIIAHIGEKLEKNDVINSSKGAKAQITLDDHTIITIWQNSTLNIFEYVFDENNPKESKASIGFMKGAFKSITGKIGKINKERFKLRTKTATIGIRGTTIIGDQNIIACTDGAITVTAEGISVDVEKQEFTKTFEGQAPTPPEPLKQDTLDTLEEQSNTAQKEEDTSANQKNDDSNSDKDGTLTPDNEEKNTPLNEASPVTQEEAFTAPTVVEDVVDDENEPKIPTNLAPTFPDTFASLILKSDSGSYSFLSNGVVMSNFTQTYIKGSINGLDNLDYSTESGTNYDANLDIAYGSFNAAGNNSDSYSLFWVTGVKTAQNIVQNIMNETSVTAMNFNGTTGSATAVISNAQTSYSVASNFNFNFGGGDNSFAGTITLSRTGESLQIDVKNGTAYSTGFKSTDLTSSGTGSGALNGGYFGSGSIKAIGGTFNFTNTNGTYTGNFVAPKN